MSRIKKVVTALTPSESHEARKAARVRAQSLADPDDWLSNILAHHRQIEAAFADVKASTTEPVRLEAQRRLGVILTGHANAEESVLYPALAEVGDKGHAATTAYAEQAAAKTQMGLLENLAPMSQAYLEKLDHIRDAVAHHMYEEEGTWFPELKGKASAADQTKLTRRYAEEFNRYVGDDAAGFKSARYASGGR
jgi:hemerythrin superfamily protein